MRDNRSVLALASSRDCCTTAYVSLKDHGILRCPLLYHPHLKTGFNEGLVVPCFWMRSM